MKRLGAIFRRTPVRPSRAGKPPRATGYGAHPASDASQESRWKRSLFLRLMLGMMTAMFLVWLCVLGWGIYAAVQDGNQDLYRQLRTTARQILVGMVALADRPGQMRQVAQQVERLGNAQDKSGGWLDTSLFVDVWEGRRLIYGAPQRDPHDVHQPALPQDKRIAWTERDPASGVTVRVSINKVDTAILSPSSIGFFFLPLLLSFPFLVIPTWFAIKIGLRPLRHISDEIAGRAASDLSPLTAPVHSELLPLVASVNRLMARLKERLDREQDFLADAAHELKTPLAVIQVNAESMASTTDRVRLREAKDGLSHGVARATRAVHQLLSLARAKADAGKQALQAIDLVELVRDRMAQYLPLAWPRNIELELHSEERRVLWLHRASVVSLIDNLLDNAVKYSPDGGMVTVRIERHADATRLIVADEGPGIAPAFRDKVFERFFRAPGQEQTGSGLGLSIAQAAAAQNHAAIRLDVGTRSAGLAVTVDFAGGSVMTESDTEARAAK
ncbi:MAG TPA: ATP-binding protein [Paucimonas sp.]|nr:ATP-binding protein [Paucimonas sp.]